MDTGGSCASLLTRSMGGVDLMALLWEEWVPLMHSYCMADCNSEKDRYVTLKPAECSTSYRAVSICLLKGRLAFCRTLWTAWPFPQ